MHLLLADDNPVTLEFLAAAVRRLGHDCRLASDGNSALALALAEYFDLLLLDLRMPGLDGRDVLQQLRASTGAGSRRSPAIATTAEPSPALARELVAAGFTAVLGKPLDLAALERALHDNRGYAVAAAEERADDYAQASLLDDAAAERRLGSRDTVQALRRLFASELQALPQELDACVAAADAAALRERLHRLAASAGFCGAAQLEATIRTLRRDLDQGQALQAATVQPLRDTAMATLALMS